MNQFCCADLAILLRYQSNDLGNLDKYLQWFICARNKPKRHIFVSMDPFIIIKIGKLVHPIQNRLKKRIKQPFSLLNILSGACVVDVLGIAATFSNYITYLFVLVTEGKYQLAVKKKG